MRILIACPMPEFALEELRSLGADLAYEPNLPAERLRQHIAGAAILVVDKTRVSPEAIRQGPGLQLIVRAGAGVTNIADDEAAGNGVFVCHCPGKDAHAIAELTFGLILALDRSLLHHALAMREQTIAPQPPGGARGLAGRTLGVLGFDTVGRQVAILAQAFGMEVFAWAPTLTPEQAQQRNVRFCNWPRVLARQSDVVVVHATRETEDEALVNAEFLESMRSGAYLVHVGHPGAVDRAALADAIERKQLRVACDMYATEPAGEVARLRARLLNRPDVICTHRIAAATQQAGDAIAAEVVNIVKTFLISGDVHNCVNLCERSPATWQLVLRVRDRVGVMAAILDTIRADGINAEEITSRVFTGARAACCTISLDERPSAEALNAIRILQDVLHLELRAMV